MDCSPNRPRNAWLCLLAAAFCLLLRANAGASPATGSPVPSPPGPFQWFVSPEGNDAWSGHLPAPSAAGTDGPLATMEAACNRIGDARAKNASASISVWIRGGRFYLPHTINLTAADSGTATGPTAILAYPGEHPDLIGGLPIDPRAFQPCQGQILKTNLAAQGFGPEPIHQLFFNGQRQILARYPNFDPQNPVSGGWAYVDGKPIPMYREIPGETKNTLVYRLADARQWAHPEDAEVMVFPRYNWWNNLLPVKSVDPATRTITLGANASYPIRPGDRYYVQNVLEELDSPGEWYLDRRDHSLYFWPPAPLAGSHIEAPVLENLLVLNGANHVIVHGLQFECCEGTAIQLNGCENCAIEACTIDNVVGKALPGFAAIEINGGHDNGAEGDDIFQVGSKGIVISGGDRTTLQPGGNFADNNYIHHTGVFYKQGSAIALTGVGNRASHNLIHDTPRYGIEFSGNDLVIEYNRIRQTNLETSDTGAIESWSVDWTKRGTQIRYNFITDTIGFGQENGRYVSPHFNWGVYLDDGTCGTSVYGNIIAREVNGGAVVHGGRDNVFENNIFVDGARWQMQYNGYGPGDKHLATMTSRLTGFQNNPAYAKYPGLAILDPAQGYRMAGNKFLHNIVVYSGLTSLLYQAKNLPYDETQSDYNLIFHHGLPLLLATPGVGAVPWGQWDNWKALGFETHSAIADPLFVDAAHDDYRLQPNSPALALGFVPIPVEHIGPYASPKRASWPIVEAEGEREHPTAGVTEIPGPSSP